MFGFVLFIIGIVVHPNPHRIKSILRVNTKQCIIFALCVDLESVFILQSSKFNFDDEKINSWSKISFLRFDVSKTRNAKG
jgi:hypothetical protein